MTTRKKTGEQEESTTPEAEQQDKTVVQTEALAPAVVEKAEKHTAVVEEVIPNLLPGEVWLVALDAAQNEIPRSGFRVTERMYNKRYNDETKFKLKKKSQ